MRLRRLIGTPTLEDFFEGIWERAAWLNRGAVGDSVTELLTLDELEVLMAGAPAGRTSWLSIVDGHTARPPGGDEGSPIQLASAYHAYRKGSTFLLSQLQLRWPPITKLCRDIENELLGHGIPLVESVGANAYLSPGHSQGFDIHYDNHCVLVIQLRGRKRWEVFAPREELPVERCTQPIPRDQLGAPVLDTDLAAGDVLYIPRGFPHAARTREDSSLHLTLSLRTMTWLDALGALCRTKASFRRSLPPAMATRARGRIDGELLSEIAELNVSDFVQRRVSECLAGLNPIPQGHLRAIDESAAVGADTPVRRAPHTMCVASEEDGQAVLRFPGATLRLPAVMKPVFDFVTENEEFTAGQLPPIHGDYEAVKLTRILIQQGLVQAALARNPGTDPVAARAPSEEES
jgi:hypothetical protein